MADYYVDYAATNDGTGATAAQAGSPGGAGAFSTLAGKTFVSNDKVWIRRVTSSNQGSSLTLSASGVLYIGWPKSGDEYYNARPASGTSNGWDSDSNNEFVWKTATASLAVIFSSVGARYYRIKVQNDATPNTTLFNVSGSGNYFNRCYANVNTTMSSSSVIALFSGNGNRAVNCTFAVNSFATTTTTSAILGVSGSGNKIVAPTITTVSHNSTNSNGLIYVPGRHNHFWDVAITITGSSTTSLGYILNFDSGSHNIFENITLTTTAPTNATYGLITDATSPSNYNKIRNFSFDYFGTATTPANIINISGNNNNFSLVGGVENRTAQASRVLVNFGNSANKNTVTLRNITRNNVTTSAYDINFAGTGDNNTVYCDGVTFSTYPVANFGAAQRNWVYSANHNGQTGLWKGFNREGTIESSNTTRTGGETFSLRLENLAKNDGSAENLQFGLRDGQATFITLSAGSRTLVLYGAYKLFGSSPPTKQDIWFETEKKENELYSSFVTTHDADNAALESDDSVWINDPGVTAFKITKTFSVASSCVVPLRLFYSKQVPNGYVYLDPLVVIT